MKEVIKTNKAQVSAVPCSQGYRAGDFVFVSGTGPFDSQTGRLQGDTIEEQTKQTLENIKDVLRVVSASMEDVVKVSVLLSDADNFEPMNKVYKTFFHEPFPARICYGVALMSPDMLVEIDAVAYVGK